MLGDKNWYCYGGIKVMGCFGQCKLSFKIQFKYCTAVNSDGFVSLPIFKYTQMVNFTFKILWPMHDCDDNLMNDTKQAMIMSYQPKC